MQYARGLDRSKADTFVGMYVNDWTLDYGDRGREAVRQFLQRGVERRDRSRSPSLSSSWTEASSAGG